MPPPRPAPLRLLVRPACLVLLVAGGVVPTASAQEAIGRRCAVEAPTAAELARTTQIVQRRRVLGGAFLRIADAPTVVPVAVHVVTSGGLGATDAQVAAQLDVLNAAFESMDVRFVLAAFERVENPTWADGLRINSADERAMKRALALDPTVYLNLYATRVLADDYLGWATLPDDPEAGTTLDGVVVGSGTLPGGDAAPFNEGDTGVHEVGHWVGLEHTFAGGCSAPGDGVADTPQERSPASGCPTSRDSCPSDPGLDPVENYMDYSTDACMTGFTPGQRERARALTAELRPAVAAGGRVLATVPRSAFEGTFVGVPRAAPLRVTNTTDSPVTITAVRTSSAALVAGGMGTVVPAGGVAVLEVVLTAAEAGPVEATVAVETDGADPQTVAISAVATLPPLARLATEAARVAAVEGDTVAVEVALTNAGGADLSFAVDAAPPWVAAVDPAEGTLAPGATATLTVTVSTDGLDVPAGQRRREVDGALTLSTNDPLRPALEIPLTAVVSERPDAFAVGAPYPNPGRGRITVPLAFPDDADGVTVEVYDALGRRVAILADDASFSAGFPELVWEAGAVPSGVYLVQARTASGAALARVVVAR